MKELVVLPYYPFFIVVPVGRFTKKTQETVRLLEIPMTYSNLPIHTEYTRHGQSAALQLIFATLGTFLLH